MPDTQIFDPSTVTPDQTAGLVNIPGQSLTATNTESQINAAQNMNPSANIPAYKATPTSAVPLPQAPAAPDYNAIMAGVNNAQVKYDSTEAQIQADTKSLGNQSADQATYEDKFGVGADKQGIIDLKAQLSSLNAEAMAETVKLGNQPILSSIAQGQQSQVEKLRAIKALSISGQIEAAQGNLTLANDQVDRAIKLKYDPIKAEIDTLNKQLEYNYKNLTAAQKEKADAIKDANDIKLKQVAVQETNDKEWATNKNQALANGAPLSVVQKAEALRSQGQEDAARALLSSYTGTKGNQVVGYDANGNPVYAQPGGGSGQFTQANLNKGAALANVSMDDFKKFSNEAQNAFINNFSSISSKEKEIDNWLNPKATPSNPAPVKYSSQDIEGAIANDSLPSEIKNYLTKYLKSKANSI